MSHVRCVGAVSRRASRHQVVYECNVVRERDGEGIAGVAIDFSIGGMLAVTRSRVLTGEPVRVMFRTPVTGRWLTLHGTVARVLHGRRPSDRGRRRLGIEFDAPTASDFARLHEANERLDVTPFWA